MKSLSIADLYTGLFLGTLVCSFIYTGLLFLRNRRADMFYYCLYALLMALYVVFRTYLPHFNMKNDTAQSNLITEYLQIGGLLVYYLFFRAFLETQQKAKNLNRMLLITVGIIAVYLLGLLIYVVLYPHSTQTGTIRMALRFVVLFPISIVLLGMSLKNWNYLMVYMFTAGSAMFLSGLMATISQTHFVYKNSFVIMDSLTWVQLGILVELLFFILGLNAKNTFVLKQLIASEQAMKEKNIRQEYHHQATQIDLLNQERTRLAQDLHDSLGGMLSGIKLNLNSMKGNSVLDASASGLLLKTVMQLDDSIVELRRVAHSMMPEALIRFGLNNALENFCDDLTQSQQIRASYQSFGMEKRIQNASNEIVVYRLVQEIINNALKHAQAQNLQVQLIQIENKLSITIDDDGVGFDVNSAKKSAGNGIENIRQRVAYLNGSLDIESEVGKGTSFYIEVNV